MAGLALSDTRRSGTDPRTLGFQILRLDDVGVKPHRQKNLILMQTLAR
jgi:hypothetical protein